jgi:hypothetical protein
MAFNRRQFLWAASAGAAGLALPDLHNQPNLSLNSNWVWAPTLLGCWTLTTSLVVAKK